MVLTKVSYPNSKAAKPILCVCMYVYVFATERQIKIKLPLCLSKQDAIETQGTVEVSGQLVAMAALLSEKNPAVPIG
jgi:hypothetical protein